MLHITICGNAIFSMTVCKTDTVLKIKETIKEKDNIPNIDMIELLYNNKILRNDEILKDLKIQQNSKLKYTIANSIIGGNDEFFGLEMADITNKEGLKKRNFGKNAKKWNIVKKGLNIQGECKNPDCEAYKCKVHCKIGFRDFNLLDNICDITCPMCSINFLPETCVFCRCQYQIEGILSLSGEIKDVKKKN